MASVFPAALDSFTSKIPHASPNAAADINKLQDCVLAIETALKTAPNPNTLDYISKSGPVNFTNSVAFSSSVTFNAGAIADVALSANVALLTGSQTFSGAKAFSAGISVVGGDVVGPTAKASFLSIAAAGLTGATSPSRYAGATTFGPPTSGTYLTGDFVVAMAERSVWLCIAGGTPGTWQKTGSPAFFPESYGALGNGVANDAAAIQAANDAAAAANGGVVLYRAVVYGVAALTGSVGISISTKNVFHMGQGANWRGYVATHTGSTTLKALTAGMTIMRFAPPAVGAGTAGWGFGGCSRIFFAGNNALANIGLEVLTWLFGRFTELGFDNFAVAALHHGVIAAGAWDLAQANRSSQRNVFDQISFGDVVAGTGYYFWINGDTAVPPDAGGDASKNVYSNIACVFSNQDAFRVGDSDNETFINLHLFRAAGGTGNAMVFEAGVHPTVVARAHSIWMYTANAPTIIQGTETNISPAYGIQFRDFDDDNATPAPTIGTGVVGVSWVDHHGKWSGEGVKANKVTIDQGTAALPSLSLSTDATTGLFQAAGGSISMAVAGKDRFRWGTTFALLNANAVVTGTAPITVLNAFNIHGADASQTSMAIASYGATPSVLFRRANGTAAVLTALVANDQMGGTHLVGYEGTTPAFTGQKLAYDMQAVETWTTAAQGYRHRWLTTAAAGVVNNEKMRLESTGSLLVGTTVDGMTAAGSLAIAQDLGHRGTKVGFYNTAPAVKQTVTGSRAANAALASLLTALATAGLITDSSTA